MPTTTPVILVSTDAAGLVLLHTLTSWMVRTTITTKTLIDYKNGPVKIYPLLPFEITLPPLQNTTEVNLNTN